MTVELILACFFLLIGPSAAVAIDRRKRRLSTTTDRLVGETIAIHTRGPESETIRGVVVARHSDRLVLADAVLELGNDVRAPVPGISEIPLFAIAWWQRLTPPEE